MRKVFLVTGFNNWGKTHIISDLFRTKAFSHSRLHALPGSSYQFLVLPYSNDDLRLRGYCEMYYERLAALKPRRLTPKYVISAFCPTKEWEARQQYGPKDKNSIDIITELYSDAEVHMLLLLHKWCDHASLRPKDIASFYSGLSNVHVHTISSTAYPARLASLTATVNAHLP